MNTDVILLWRAEVAGRCKKEFIAFSFHCRKISSGGSVADSFQYCAEKSEIRTCPIGGSAKLQLMAFERACLVR